MLSMFHERLAFAVFFTGKALRFILSLAFIFVLVKGSREIAGYSLNQVLFFFLTFNLVDVIAQFFFREVYRFRPQVLSGEFDLILSKPVSALFRALMGGADVIDLATIPFLLFMVIYFGIALDPALFHIVLYLVLILNSLLIAAAFHIAVISLGIITLEVDHTIMIYRDLVKMGSFPVEIYKEPLRGFLTFVVPIGLMFTVPSRVFMGISTNYLIAFALVFGFGSLFLALRFWKYALRFYTSASS